MMLIHRDALAVSGVTGRKRYYLDGALFDAQGRAVATDGHLLVRYTSKPVALSAFRAINGLGDVMAAEDVIVDGAALGAACATMNKDAVMAIVPNGSNVTLATSRDGHSVCVTARKIDGTFPHYERVLTVTHPVVARVILDPVLLSDLAHVAREVGARCLVLTLHAGTGEVGVTDQVLFTADGTNGTLDGALMPMRF